jgi:hypothetical protein
MDILAAGGQKIARIPKQGMIIWVMSFKSS